MSTIVIPLINTCLNIEVNQKPKMEKLKKELSDFFGNNLVSGVKIKNFILYDNFDIHTNLSDEEKIKFSSDKSYVEKINEIGKKYGVNNLNLIAYR